MLFALGSACDEGHSARLDTASPLPSAALPKILGIDAQSLPPPADPPAPAGNLQAELEAFTTIDACVEARARLDPLVGEAIEAIGYDTLLRDACRILDAAKAREPKRCEAIETTALRERCQTTAAQVVGDADACPWSAPARPRLGRDPVCVAIASRDPRLCAAAAKPSAQTTCEAIVTHDIARCDKLLAPSDASRCTRTTGRWRAAIPAPSAQERPPLRAMGTLHIETTDAGLPLDDALDPDLRRGVVVDEEPDGAHVFVGSLSEAGFDFIAPSPHVRATFAFQLLAPNAGSPSERAYGARLERAELVVPGRAAFATPVANSTLRATLSRFSPQRGAPLEVSIDGTLGDSAGTWRVHAQIATFVRDVFRSTGQGQRDSIVSGPDLH